ncbi:CoxG family protein [Nocardioides sp.]|uniref:CoxG family protein n=1 Tax=Nocardioides sp. TaxID=35761 RepID=UPI002ED596D7
MASFSRTRRDTADVPHPVEAVWEVLVDPDAIARLTPLVSSIDVDDDGRWIWCLQGVPAPGRRFDLTMTEEMTFQPRTRIEFTHAPLERGVAAGADGRYTLDPVDDGTRLSIELTVTARLPLPGLAAPAVHTVMQQVLDRMGTRFAANLLEELDRRD